MMKAAEDLYGPYRWGRYDVLVLPPSFPYGGMENPRITFLTPTIIAGDLGEVAAYSPARTFTCRIVPSRGARTVRRAISRAILCSEDSVAAN